MSNYTKTTNFGAKDTLPSGDSQKIIRGTEFDTEFNAISTAIATKLEVDGSNNLAISGTFSATKLIPTGGSATGNGMYLPAANAVAISTNGTERLRVDASGNLGLGVTPGAWGTTSLQIGVTGFNNYGSQSNLYNNTVTDASNNPTYISSLAASAYRQVSGAHSWLIAPSGTAGNAITFTTAMLLDSSGNLGLGVTPSASGSTYGGSQMRTLTVQSANIVSAAGYDAHYAQNAYRLTDGSWRYQGNGGNNVAHLYSQATGGSHIWYTAPSGTAGNAITFTQAMTLDASGNLGIGVNSPAAILHTKSSAGAVAIETTQSRGTNNTFVSFRDPTGEAGYIGYGASNSNFYTWNALSGSVLFGTSNTERMRLDASGNLGIGATSLDAKLHIYTPSADVRNAILANGVSDAAFSVATWQGVSGSTDGVLIGSLGLSYSTTKNAHINFHRGSATTGGFLTFSTNDNTERMRLDASGNLLVGGTTTVSGGRTVVYSSVGTVGQLVLENPSFVSGQGSGIEFTTAGGSRQSFIRALSNNSTTAATDLIFGTASGGNNATERARIDSSGNLLVGTTATIGGFSSCKLTVVSSAGSYFQVTGGAASTNYAHNTATTGDNSFLTFGTEAAFTTRGSIDYNRAGGLVRYNTTSDYRAKDIIGPVQDPGATIDALKVYEGKMKDATQSRPMLIAHEAQEHAPYAVSGVKDEVNEDGTPKLQQIDVSSLVPLLLAEIQSLRARVASLENS